MNEDDILGQYNWPHEEEMLAFQADILSGYNAQNNAEQSYFQNANPLDIAYNPVHYAQPDVEEVQEVRLENDYAKAMENIAKIAATSEGAKVMNHLITLREIYTVKGISKSTESTYIPKDNYRGGEIRYDVNPSNTELDYEYGGGVWNSTISMGHEMRHAFDHSQRVFSSKNFRLHISEPLAVSFTNYLRQTYSLSPLRTRYHANYDIKGDFRQFPSNEIISDFQTLGHNADQTAFAYSYTKTTTIVESYKTGVLGIRTPLKTRIEITYHYIIVYRDKNKNDKVSFKIFNDTEEFLNATSNW